MKVWQRIKKSVISGTYLKKIRNTFLTEKAMQLVLEDFMARQKALEDWMAPLNRNIRRTEGVVVRRAQTAEIRTT